MSSTRHKIPDEKVVEPFTASFIFSELKNDIRNLSNEIKGDIRHLDAKIDKVNTKVDTNFRWMLGIFIVSTISIIATIILN